MFSWFTQKSPTMVSKEEALPDNSIAIQVSPTHCVTNNATVGPFPENLEVAIFAMGCFWGAERDAFGNKMAFGLPKSSNFDPEPSLKLATQADSPSTRPSKQVCSGRTGHTEVVQVVFDPATISYAQLLKVFWEAHDPTQGNRQGNDVGTQYRSAIYATTDDQLQQATESSPVRNGKNFKKD